jgi:alcohol dehydrogenase (cytochrome c)
MTDNAGYARVTRGRIRRVADDGTNDANSKQQFKTRIQTDEKGERP